MPTTMLETLVLLAATCGGVAATPLAPAPPCVAAVPGGPLQITESCVDPLFSVPVVESETDFTSSSPYRQVRGYFDGTDVYFSIYLPPTQDWTGRFFHHVYPLVTEDGEGFDLDFALHAGAMFIQTRAGSGYRADAAAAKFARVVAARYYGTDPSSNRIYGYIYGGSGGSFQTIGAMENTFGVWDGGVPIVQAVPVSNPNSMSVRALTSLVLRPKVGDIADAIRVGGHGDPYRDLDAVQRDVLREISGIGLPLRAWEDFSMFSSTDGLLQMLPTVRAMDPSYADDWWSRPGYLGTESSPLGELLRAAKSDFNDTVSAVERNARGSPARVVLSGSEQYRDAAGLEFTVYSTNEDGSESPLGPLLGTLDASGTAIELADGISPAVLDSLAPGLSIRIDNRWFIAMHTYYRHQIPLRDGFYGFDVLRDPEGKPIHPQRGIDVSSIIAASVTGGAAFTGNITGKVIAVNNLLDAEAFPWHADWYRDQVRRSLGCGARDGFRLWYNDHADHGMGPVPRARADLVVDFRGIYHQALLDLSAWVEEGTPPPDSSGYAVEDGQVILSEGAAARRGVQPLVSLTSGGAQHVQASVGEQVELQARIEVPPGVGMIVSVEWDLDGVGDFVSAPFEAPAGGALDVETVFTCRGPGAQIVAVRVTAQRDGTKAKSIFTRVMNLGRLRVICK